MVNKLQKIRLENDMTQEEIARKANISLSYYQQLEYNKKKPNIYIGLKISKILKTDPYEIFSIDE